MVKDEKNMVKDEKNMVKDEKNMVKDEKNSWHLLVYYYIIARF